MPPPSDEPVPGRAPDVRPDPQGLEEHALPPIISVSDPESFHPGPSGEASAAELFKPAPAPEALSCEEATPPPPVSAYDRVQSRPETPEEADRRRLPWRILGLVGLLALGLVLALAYMQRGGGGDGADLLSRAVDEAEAFSPALATSAPAEAEDYIISQYEWPIAVPELEGLALTGVGDVELARSPPVLVPAFSYASDQGEVFVVAYDYVLLDQTEGRLTLLPAVLARLAEADPVDTRRLEDAFLVTWRERAVIYTAVTRSEAVFEQVVRSVRTE